VTLEQPAARSSGQTAKRKLVCTNSIKLKTEHVQTDLFMAQQALVGQGLLNIEASRLHSDTPRSVCLLCTSDQPDAETSTGQHTTYTQTHHARYASSVRVISPTQRPLPDNTQHSLETDIRAPAGFGPAIPESERPQTHASKSRYNSDNNIST